MEEQKITTDALIESVLFFKGEPISVKKLSEILKVSEDEIRNSLGTLEEKLKGRGVGLMWKDDEVMLRTSAQASELISEMTKEELTRDLGKAGLETLTIVLYKSPVSRREIDYIRGVNSNFILRNLLIRGLVEKITNEKDQRSFLYKPTFELLSYLGVQKIEDLPEYESVAKEISDYAKSESETSGEEESKLEPSAENTNA